MGPSLQACADRAPRLAPLFLAGLSCRSPSLTGAPDCRRRLCCAHAERTRHWDGKAPKPFPGRWQLFPMPLPSPPVPQHCRARGTVSATLPGEPAISRGPRTWASVSLAASGLLCEVECPPLKTCVCAGNEGSVGGLIHRESSLRTGRFNAGQPSHQSRTTPSPAGEPDRTAHHAGSAGVPREAPACVGLPQSHPSPQTVV